ncbi:MAG: DUF3078 domain-containing protein [Crocinitomicaceae bacterium]|nr:DUF3078 domain-containing protein [Crocinitomicaceae bacterium]
MRNRTLTTLLTALFFHPVFAQVAPTADEEKNMKSLAALPDSGWIVAGTLNINTTQTYLKNWAAGGNNSVNITGIINYTANYRKGKSAWDNVLNLAYGRNMISFDSPSIKTDDRIDFTSKYGRKASAYWFYTALLNFKTQFAAGYTSQPNGLPDYNKGQISNFMAPAYGLIALGMDYKPNNSFSAFIAPLTYRSTLVMDQKLADAGQFGVDPAKYDALGFKLSDGKKIRNEFGGYIRVNYTKDLMENVKFTTKLELFSNYLDRPQNVDINWENLLALKVNKFLNITITTQMIYDNDIIIVKSPEKVDELGNVTRANIGPGLQFREVAALGFTLNF